MREIGIVTRFAPPTKKSQEKAFAFIKRLECEGTPEIEIPVYQGQLRCAADDYIRGMFVEFEVGINPQEDRAEARDVCLLTQIGQVKYFGVKRKFCVFIALPKRVKIFLKSYPTLGISTATVQSIIHS